jgi:error-prone DNA polymerase
VRLGFNYVLRLGETGGKRIEEARGNLPFTDLADFYRRTNLPESHVENLIMCGAMDKWGIPRRQLLWQLGTVEAQVNQLGLVFEDDPVDLPPLTKMEKLQAEYGVMGLSTNDHVIAHHRAWLSKKGCITSKQLQHCRDGEKVRIAGMSMVLQRPPTAKGTAFLTLQDEFLLMVDGILSRDVFERYEKEARKLLPVIEGKVQKRGNVINVRVERVYDLQAKFLAA